jgi:hypothetical protein
MVATACNCCNVYHLDSKTVEPFNKIVLVLGPLVTRLSGFATPPPDGLLTC